VNLLLLVVDVCLYPDLSAGDAPTIALVMCVVVSLCVCWLDRIGIVGCLPHLLTL